MNSDERQSRILVQEIGAALRVRGWWLCVAESVTVGHIQTLIGGVSGASEFFGGGITAYTLEQKVRHLEVDRDAAAAANCVSPLVCRQMARGACRRFQADLAIATTGYAEPAPEFGVTEPLAFVSIYRGGSVDQEVVATYIHDMAADPWLDDLQARQLCQRYVAEKAIQELHTYLCPPVD